MFNNPNNRPGAGELRDLAALFLRLGCTSFGGPVAHIALMEHEVVTQRGWLSHGEFLDLVGATNIIPGPNSTEMAIHIGKLRGGWAGLLVAGLCFICPAMFMMIGLAALYARYGTVPAARWLMLGVQPVVVAIICKALAKFAGSAITNRWTAVLALAAAALAALHDMHRTSIDEVTILFGAAVIGLAIGVWRRSNSPNETPNSESAPSELVEKSTSEEPRNALGRGGLWWFGAAPVFTLAPNAGGLFLAFLKIGSVLYGSGYVLLAFLRSDFVEHLHWITDRQLVDAVAMGQLTPGPLFTTATYVGYQVAGIGGALAATLGIFRPSFVFVGLLSVMMAALKRSVVMRSFLDAVNAASFALMVVVSLEIGNYAIAKPWPNPLPLVTFSVALVLLVRTKINSTWLLAGGAVVGLAGMMFGAR